MLSIEQTFAAQDRGTSVSLERWGTGHNHKLANVATATSSQIMIDRNQSFFPGHMTFTIDKFLGQLNIALNFISI